MNKLSIFEKKITKITNNNNYKRFEVLHDLATCEKGQEFPWIVPLGTTSPKIKKSWTQ